jgi:peptidoglycan/xylan/chitin deacetylase (PgdA/CDA1 family)
MPGRGKETILSVATFLIIPVFVFCSGTNLNLPAQNPDAGDLRFSVNLTVNGMSEEEEENPGGVIRINADFDEKNRNEKGNLQADYQPDEKKGHRMVEDDPNLKDGSLTLSGAGKGKWKLLFPENIKIWRKSKDSTYEEIISDRFSKKVNLPFFSQLKVEGIKGSRLVNDVKITAEFSPAKSREIYHDSVFLTVLETQFAVTFDDGPLPEKTEKIVKALNNFYYNGEPVRAAFFQIGIKINKFGDLTRFVHQNGHLVLNHTYYHANFGYRMLNDEEIRNDIILCQQEIRKALGREPEKIIRTRSLREEERFDKEIKKLGYRICKGELLNDWKASSFLEVQARAEEVLEAWNTRENPGLHPYPAILIFHVFPEVTYDHIGEIIGYLQDRGFVLVNFDPNLIY